MPELLQVTGRIYENGPDRSIYQDGNIKVCNIHTRAEQFLAILFYTNARYACIRGIVGSATHDNRSSCGPEDRAPGPQRPNAAARGNPQNAP